MKAKIRSLIKNWPIKLLAIAISVILCLYSYKHEESGRLPLLVPIKIKNLSDDKVVLLPSSLQAQVRMKGSTTVLNEVIRVNRYFEVKLPEDVKNSFKLSLSSKDINLPAGVEVTGIEPSEIELILDDVTSKIVPIAVTRMGKVDSGIRLLSQTVSPARVEVSGPSTYLQKITRIETFPVDMRELKESKIAEMELRVPGQFIKLSENLVKVELKVDNLVERKKFTELPVEVRSNGGAKVEIDPAVVTVEISGSKKMLQKLKSEDLSPYIKLSDIDDEKKISTVLIDLPEDIELVDISPKKVNIIIDE